MRQKLEVSEMLPDLFGMDNFFECAEKHKEPMYCKVYASLHPVHSGSAVGNLIEERKKLKLYYFDRSEVIRMICVPKNHSSSPENIKKYSQEVLNYQFDNNTFTSSINSINCFNIDDFGNYPPYFQPFIVGLLLYLAWIIFATMYEKRATERGPKYKANEWISSFSLKKNWATVTSLKQNDDAMKLQCFQGVRVFTLLYVITCHAGLTMVQLFLRNTEYVEKMYQDTATNIGMRITIFVVQSFFVLSSWLLTNQIYDIYHKNGEFTLKDCCILFINRLFRFWPTLIIMEIVLMQLKVFCSPQILEIVDMITDTCSSNWWITLLFFNNFYNFNEMCNGGTWYLSADTQFFLSTLIVCYVVLKFKLDMKKVLGLLIPFSVLLFAAIKYYYNLPMTNDISPNDIMRHIFWNEATYVTQYTSPISSWTTNLIGIATGYAYYYTKDKRYNFGTITTVFWAVSFFVLPIVPCIISASHQYITSRLSVAIVGALLKPLYSVGIAIGVIGMVHGIGGPLKTLYECKLFNVLGNMSFSIYIWHFIPTFLRGVFTFELFYIQDMEALLHQMGNLLICVALGATFCLILEQPFLNLQKKILPQLKRHKMEKQTANDTQKKE